MVGQKAPLAAEQYEAAIELAAHQLARAEKAREAAELLLEIRGRTLAKTNEDLRLRDSKLRAQIEQDTQKLLAAQELAQVATFHVQPDGSLIGSRNLGSVLGLTTELRALSQVCAMIHPLEGHEAAGYLSGEICDANVGSRDIRMLDQTGTTRWLHWTIRHSLNGDGSYYGAVRDITVARRNMRGIRASDALRARQLRKLERVSTELQDRVGELGHLSATLEDSRNQAVQADQAKSRFLAMMSHDIRTPMNAILAMLDLLATTNLQSEQTRLLDLARTSGEQMLFLLADILEISRTDGWSFDLEPATVDMTHALPTIIDAWKPLATRKGLELSLYLAPDLPQKIVIDPTRLRQLLDNLISNAIKYTVCGFIDISANCVFLNDEPAICMTVSDSGPGISPHEQERLFEDGKRLQEQINEGTQGTGLGLGICRRIVKAMRGEIGLASSVGHGSNFTVTLPYVTPEQTGHPAISEKAEPIIATPITARKQRLLVAEDIETNRIVMAALLDQLGYDYIFAHDGQTAIDISRHESFDAILMDVSMPLVDGMEAARQIRASGSRNAQLPIIAVTAFATEDEKAAILASGMDMVLSKPVRLAGLEAALQSIMLKEHAPPEPNIPSFQPRPMVDASALRAQLFAVPDAARAALVSAIVDDLSLWVGRYCDALKKKDEAEMSRAHHALRGICGGFGAQALLDALMESRQPVGHSQQDECNALHEMLDQTCTDIRRIAAEPDRRSRLSAAA